jgi:hypothetical protein
MSRTTHGLGDTSGYEIRVGGHIGDHAAEWFEGMGLDHQPDGSTVIRCPALDQAALHGVLHTLRDLGLALISVTGVGTDGGAASDHRPSDQRPTTDD